MTRVCTSWSHETLEYYNQPITALSGLQVLYQCRLSTTKDLQAITTANCQNNLQILKDQLMYDLVIQLTFFSSVRLSQETCDPVDPQSELSEQ